MKTGNIKEEPFTCRRESLTIRGMQYFPADFMADRKYPIVVLSHGFTGNHTDMADYGRNFAPIGYVAYAFSFCGGGQTGEPEISKSDGRSTDMTVATEVEDLLTRASHETVVGMEPFLELSAYRGKVLLIQGMEDTVVHYSYAVRAKACYQEGQCHLQLMKDQGHGYDENQRESVFGSIRQFLADREEVLTIHVFITHSEVRESGEHWKNDVYFIGYCDTKYFRGVISPEGCDAQEHCAGTGVKMRADYTMTGLDDRQERCAIHIVNQRVGEEWKPVLETDSPSLKWLNHADLTAVLEGGDGGLTVQIFAHEYNVTGD